MLQLALALMLEQSVCVQGTLITACLFSPQRSQELKVQGCGSSAMICQQCYITHTHTHTHCHLDSAIDGCCCWHCQQQPAHVAATLLLLFARFGVDVMTMLWM
jgi:hypothetical protein